MDIEGPGGVNITGVAASRPGGEPEVRVVAQATGEGEFNPGTYKSQRLIARHGHTTVADIVLKVEPAERIRPATQYRFYDSTTNQMISDVEFRIVRTDKDGNRTVTTIQQEGDEPVAFPATGQEEGKVIIEATRNGYSLAAQSASIITYTNNMVNFKNDIEIQRFSRPPLPAGAFRAVLSCVNVLVYFFVQLFLLLLPRWLLIFFGMLSRRSNEPRDLDLHVKSSEGAHVYFSNKSEYYDGEWAPMSNNTVATQGSVVRLLADPSREGTILDGTLEATVASVRKFKTPFKIKFRDGSEDSDFIHFDALEYKKGELRNCLIEYPAMGPDQSRGYFHAVCHPVQVFFWTLMSPQERALRPSPCPGTRVSGTCFTFTIIQQTASFQ